MSKTTIRIQNDGGWSGVGGTYARDRVAVDLNFSRLAAADLAEMSNLRVELETRY